MQFYENVTRYDGVTDTERETLIEAIETKLREVSPAAATKLFGPKDSEGREHLEKIYKEIAKEFDLSGNQVKNGVKTGGDMIAGRLFVDIYLSYKNEDGWHTALSWHQVNPESARYLRVSIYQGGISNKASYSDAKYEAGQEEAALERYRNLLQDLLHGKKPPRRKY